MKSPVSKAMCRKYVLFQRVYRGKKKYTPHDPGPPVRERLTNWCESREGPLN